MASATLPFFPAFSLVYFTYLSSAQSKGQGSFFIKPIKTTLDRIHAQIFQIFMHTLLTHKTTQMHHKSFALSGRA